MRTQNRPHRRLTYATVSVVLAATTAVAADLTWFGGTGDWNDPANWNPQQVPTANDHVIINAGNINVPPNTSFAVMDWTGGSLSGSPSIVAGSVMNWSG